MHVFANLVTYTTMHINTLSKCGVSVFPSSVLLAGNTQLLTYSYSTLKTFYKNFSKWIMIMHVAMAGSYVSCLYVLISLHIMTCVCL